MQISKILEDPAAHSVLAGHPDIDDFVLFSTNDERLGEHRAVAVVPYEYCSAVEIRDLCYERLGNSAPTLVWGIDEVPRDETGEIDRGALVCSLAAASPSRFVEATTPVEQALTRIWAEVLDCERVGVEDDFLELGGDSVDAVEVAALVEDQFGIELPVEDVFDRGSIREIAEHIRPRIASQRHAGG